MREPRTEDESALGSRPRDDHQEHQEHQHLPGARTMEEILERDQRTTQHHRVLESRERLRYGTGTATASEPRCCDDITRDCVSQRTQDVEDRAGVYSGVPIAGSGSGSGAGSGTCDDDQCFRGDQARMAARRARFAIACTTWLRLGSLLVALLAVSVQSAPTMTLESRRLSSPPKWMNPCGFTAEEFDGDLDVVQLNDETLLGNIVMQAKTALNYAQGFRDDYIKRTFNTDYADLHLTWKDNHYDWLPSPRQIPKQLGEQLDQEFLDKVEVRMLDTVLLNAYEYMQRYAVGLEQIAWDQEDYSLEFRRQFKDTEYNLRTVLCELQMALAERDVTPRADVTREVMSKEYRDMSKSATYRNLRDWLIFRDYMNGLEYIIQVFEHLVRGIES